MHLSRKVKRQKMETYYVPFSLKSVGGELRLVFQSDKQCFLIENEKLKQGRIEPSLMFNPFQVIPHALNESISKQTESEAVKLLCMMGCTTEEAARIYNSCIKDLPAHGVFGY